MLNINFIVTLFVGSSGLFRLFMNADILVFFILLQKKVLHMNVKLWERGIIEFNVCFVELYDILSSLSFLTQLLVKFSASQRKPQ